MKGTAISALVIVLCIHILIMPLAKFIGNENMLSIASVVDQFCSWVFWTWVFEIIEYKVTNKRKAIKEL